MKMLRRWRVQPAAPCCAVGARLFSARRDDFADFSGADPVDADDDPPVVRRRVRLPVATNGTLAPLPAGAPLSSGFRKSSFGASMPQVSPDMPDAVAAPMSTTSSAVVDEAASDDLGAPRSAVDAELDEAEGTAVAEVARLLPPDRAIPVAAIAWVVPPAVLERVAGGDLLRFLARYHDAFTVARCRRSGEAADREAARGEDAESGAAPHGGSGEDSHRQWLIGRRPVMARLANDDAIPSRADTVPQSLGDSPVSPQPAKRVSLRPVAPGSAVASDKQHAFTASATLGIQELGAGSAVSVSALKAWLVQQRTPSDHHVGLLRKLRAADSFDVSGNGARVGPRGSLLPSELQPVRAASSVGGSSGDGTVVWEVELDLDMDTAADIRRQMDGDLEEQRLEKALARGDDVALTQDIFRSFEGEVIPAAPAAHGPIGVGYDRLVTVPAVRVQIPPEGSSASVVPRATPPPLPSAAQATPPALPGGLMAAALSAAMSGGAVEGGWKAPAEVLDALVDVVPSFFVPVALVRPSDRLRACTACPDMVQIVRRYRFFFDARPSGGGSDEGPADAGTANLALTTTSRHFDVRLASAVKHARAGAADRHFAWARQGDAATAGIPVPDDMAAALQAAAMRSPSPPGQASGPPASARRAPASSDETPENFRPARPDLAGVVSLGPATTAGSQPTARLAFLDASLRRALAVVPVPDRAAGINAASPATTAPRSLSLTAFRMHLDSTLGFEGSDATARAWLELRGDLFLILPGDLVVQRPLDAAPGAIGFAALADAPAAPTALPSGASVVGAAPAPATLPSSVALGALNATLRDDGWNDAAAVERRLISSSKTDPAAAAFVKWLMDAFTAKPAGGASASAATSGTPGKKMTAAQAAFAAKKQALAAAKAAALGGSASAVLTPATAQARWARLVLPWLRAHGATVWVHATPQSLRLRRYQGAPALDDGVEHWVWRAVKEELALAAGPMSLADAITASRQSQAPEGADADGTADAAAAVAGDDSSPVRLDWGLHFESLPPATVHRLVKLQSAFSLVSGDAASSLADIILARAQ